VRNLWVKTAYYNFLTTPLFASTSTISPFFNTLVAISQPTIQGILNSLAIMAACEVNPPSSVTIAAAFGRLRRPQLSQQVVSPAQSV